MKIDLKFKIKNLKLNLFLGILLVFGYFLTRLVNVTIVPVFCDEAIYIRWAQVMRTVPSLRFLPLSDGKQPFFMWLIIPFLKIFSDPLIAGRLVSVLSGFGTIVGVGILSYLLFKRKEVAIFSSLLYLISPFCLFFDRMALADGLLSNLGVWYLILMVSLAQRRRLDIAMLAGIVLGLSFITKSPAFFFALMMPLTTILLFNSENSFKIPRLLPLLFVYWAVVLVFGFAIYSILRLGPEFHMIAVRNKDYVFSFSEVLKHPIGPLFWNSKSVLEWYWILLTPLVFLLGITGIFGTIKKNRREGIFLLLWWLIPLLIQSAIAKVYTARYVLFTVPIFLIFAAVAINEFFQKIKNKVLIVSGLMTIFFLPIYQSFLLITVPEKTWLPNGERQGYLEIWTAGYGIKESADYFKKISKTQKVLVGTEGYFGTLPDGLQIYLEGVSNITVIGIGQPVTEISPQLLDGLKDSRVFLLVNDSRFKITSSDRIKLIARYPKALNRQGDRENLLLFEVY